MRLSRRPLIAAFLALPAGLRAQGTGAAAADAPAADPRLAERSSGAAGAPVTVQEFFSLTCSHCAAFHTDTWPRVKQELVEPGRVRMIWRDFPLDRVGLLGAMVARSLPAERYEGFIGTLLGSQQRWAFAADPIAELGRLAALAGMSRARYDAVQRDEALARGILEQRQIAEREYQLQATPSFAFRSGGRTRTHSGNLPFAQFESLVAETERA